MSESESEASEERYRYLTTARAVRERAHEILEQARAGQLEHWLLDETKLPQVVDRVIAVTRRAYPDLDAIPYHSRFRHFDVGGVGRLASLQRELSHLDSDQRLAALVELVITSVLLDAGAGAAWRYREDDGRNYTRSEGLAVASYHLFSSGALSSTSERLRADATGLMAFSSERLELAFQVGPDNPLAGAAGRAELLQNLGRVVASTPEFFGSADARLGNLALYLKRAAQNGRLAASFVLTSVLRALGPIWPGRETCAGKNLGDVFRHSRFGLVPLHKLSQWLSYSLIEALEMSSLRIDGLNELTGLAEYRNGGLFVDAGVLVLKHPEARTEVHRVDSDLIIEWRSLTVALLDRVAEIMRERLQLSATQLPLARVLEGGTWQAGREIARELRSDARPPLEIESDGTVF
ncbi:MAG: DUF1688 family protein [Myxococcota bacterium]